jgi:hypothetical protein
MLYRHQHEPGARRGLLLRRRSQLLLRATERLAEAIGQEMT